MTNSEKIKSSLKVSVIIPTYDESITLAETLTRLRPYRPFETIIGDGGSEDDTADIARHFDVRVVQSQRGRAAQMNAAAAEAKGDLLLFLHADSYIDPQGFQKMIETMICGPIWGARSACKLILPCPPSKGLPAGRIGGPAT